MKQISRDQLAIVLVVVFNVIIADYSKCSALNLGLVSTGESSVAAEGKHVSVWLPGIYSLNLDTRGGNNGSKMEQSVLFGLVRVNLDRKRGSDNKMHGPISVSVAGLTMYDNNQNSPS